MYIPFDSRLIPISASSIPGSYDNFGKTFVILQDKNQDDFSGFRFYTADEIKQDKLPSYEIFRKNIIKYFLVKPGVE